MNNNTAQNSLTDNRKAPFLWCNLETLEILKGKPWETMVYLHLIRRAGHGGKCWQSLDGMASDTGIAKRKIKDCIKTLLALGMIVRLKRPGYTDEYQVSDISCWVWPEGGGHEMPPYRGTVCPPTGAGDAPELDPNQLDPNQLKNLAAAASENEKFSGDQMGGGEQGNGSAAHPTANQEVPTCGKVRVNVPPAAPEISESDRPEFPVVQPLAQFSILKNVPPRPGYEDYVEVAGYPEWCEPHCWFWYVRAINEEMVRIGQADRTPGALRNAFTEGKRHSFWKRWIGIYLAESIPLDEWPYESPYAWTGALLTSQ